MQAVLDPAQLIEPKIPRSRGLVTSQSLSQLIQAERQAKKQRKGGCPVDSKFDPKALVKHLCERIPEQLENELLDWLEQNFPEASPIAEGVFIERKLPKPTMEGRS